MRIVKWLLNFLLLFTVSLTVIILYFPGKINLDESIDANLSESSNPSNLEEKLYSQVPILMYHYIRDPETLPDWDSVGRNLSVSPKNLEKQIIDIFDLGYEITSLSSLLKKTSARPRVVLTFDDGYSDFYQNAYPILKKYNLKATVFIIINKINVPGYLSASQIQALAANNIEVGSHSISHPNLTNTSPANVTKQLSDSREELESIIARPVVSFCYPSGKYNDETIEAISDNNYQLAVTTDYRVANIVVDELLALPRLRIKNKTDIKQVFEKLLIE